MYIYIIHNNTIMHISLSLYIYIYIYIYMYRDRERERERDMCTSPGQAEQLPEAARLRSVQDGHLRVRPCARPA